MDSSSHVTQGLLVNLSNKRESRSVAVWPSLVVPSEEWFIAVSRTGGKKKLGIARASVEIQSQEYSC